MIDPDELRREWTWWLLTLAASPLLGWALSVVALGLIKGDV